MNLSFYTGGYSTEIMTGNGIYHGKAPGISYYTSNGVTTYPEIINPSWILLHPNRRMLYCVNETTIGSVESYRIGENGALTLCDHVDSMGACPCHLAISEEADLLAISNYVSGSAVFYRLNQDGSIGAFCGKLQFVGKGNHQKRQLGPHTHTMEFADGFCYIFELGCDAIYRIPTARLRLGGFGLADVEQVVDFTADGNITGVRMGAFTPDGSICYVGGELDCRIHSFSVSENWKPLDRVMAAKTEIPSTFAQIAYHDGYVYGSLRGEDTLVRFAAKDGVLTDPIWVDCGGQTPRSFVIADGYLICANQNGDCLTVFAIGKDGCLTETEKIDCLTVTTVAAAQEESVCRLKK